MDRDAPTVLAPLPRKAPDTPSQQERFLSCSADIAVFGGAAGGGKTVGLLLEPLRHKDVKSFRAVFFRRTYPRIVKAGGMWDESEELYSGIAEPVKGDLLWRFPSGARFEFSHMQHEKDRLDFKGAQIPYIGWDQLEEFSEKQFWYLVSRNRSTCGVRPYIRATCNPVPPDDETGGWLHDLLSWWLDSESGLPIHERSGRIRWFVRDGDDLVWADSPEELQEYERPPQSLTFIPATLEDNPLLEDSDPGYRGRLMSLPRVERKRLLEGNWMVRPTAGMIFNRGWFPIVDGSPSRGEVVRYWDKAGTEGGGARSAGVRIRECGDTWYIEDLTQGRWSARQREEVILQTAESDGYGTQVYVEQEPGSSGKESAQLTIQNLKGFNVHADRVTGSKVERARGLSAQAEAGNVKLVRGDWNESFLRQAQRFEAGAKQIDAVDAACGAFNKLTVEEEEKGYAFQWG